MFMRTGIVTPSNEAVRVLVTGGILRISATNWSIVFRKGDGAGLVVEWMYTNNQSFATAHEEQRNSMTCSVCHVVI